MRKIYLYSLLLFLAACVNKDKYGREYETKEICVTGHWHDYTTKYTIGKCFNCGSTKHHDWVVDTYRIDTIYTEQRVVHDQTIYKKY